jgi:hypothetical protein
MSNASFSSFITSTLPQMLNLITVLRNRQSKIWSGLKLVQVVPRSGGKDEGASRSLASLLLPPLSLYPLPSFLSSTRIPALPAGSSAHDASDFGIPWRACASSLRCPHRSATRGGTLSGPATSPTRPHGDKSIPQHPLPRTQTAPAGTPMRETIVCASGPERIEVVRRGTWQGPWIVFGASDCASPLFAVLIHPLIISPGRLPSPPVHLGVLLPHACLHLPGGHQN